MAKRSSVIERAFSPVRSGLLHAIACQGENRVAPPGTQFSIREDALVAPHCLPDSWDRGPVVPGVGQPGEMLTREKRVLLSACEESALEGLVRRLATNGAATMKLSHLLRACIVVLRHSEPELIQHLRLGGGLVRPSNGNGRLLAAFERRLAQKVAAAIRSAPPLD